MFYAMNTYCRVSGNTKTNKILLNYGVTNWIFSQRKDICLCLPPDRTWSKCRLILWIRGGKLGQDPRLNPAGLCWSSAHLEQCEPDEPTLTLTQTWVQEGMPDYSLHWTKKSTRMLFNNILIHYFKFHS